jgi:hypothetical protein
MKVNMTLSCINETHSELLHKEERKKHFKYKYHHKARLGGINIQDIFHMVN